MGATFSDVLNALSAFLCWCWCSLWGMTLQSACRSDYWWRALPGICLIYVGAGTEQYWFVAGVDTHARTHTLAVIDSSSGRQVDTATFPAPAAGSASAAIWLSPWKEQAPTAPSCERTLLLSPFVWSKAPSPSRAVRHRKGKSDQLDALRAAEVVLSFPTARLTEAKTEGSSPLCAS